MSSFVQQYFWTLIYYGSAVLSWIVLILMLVFRKRTLGIISAILAAPYTFFLGFGYHAYPILGIFVAHIVASVHPQNRRIAIACLTVSTVGVLLVLITSPLLAALLS
jgi:hypothetical protein